MPRRRVALPPGERYTPGSRIGKGGRGLVLDPNQVGPSPQIRAYVRQSTQEAIDAEAKRRFMSRSELVREVLEREFPE